MTVSVGGGSRRTWWSTFALLFLVVASWSLVSPLMGGHDEGSHAVRGAAVVRGQLLGEPAPEAFPPAPNVNIRVDVPEAYQDIVEMHCISIRPDNLPDCQPSFSGGSELEPFYTYQFRSQPFYYAVTSLPTLVFPAATGVYLTRLVSAAICAALLASALSASAELGGARLGLLAFLTAATPEVLYLAGHVNSNGVEVAAAMALWAAALALVRTPGPPGRRQIARAGIALVVLVSARGLGPAFAVVIVAAVGVLADGERLRTLAKRRDVWAWLVAAALATALSLAYVEYVRRELPISREGQGIGYALGQLPWYLEQAVGVFASNDVRLPVVVHVVWGLVLVGLVAAAVIGAPIRRWGPVVGVLLAGLVMQVTAEGASLPPIGFFWQGRYALPLLVGVPFLAVAAITRRPDGGRAPDPAVLPGRVAAAMTTALVAAHVVAFVFTIRRYAVGADGPANPLRFLTDPAWSPPTGPAVLYASTFVAGLVALAVTAHRAEAARDTG